MQIVILTVGNELLTGDIENTNTTWSARRLIEGGATMVRIQAVPDDHEATTEAIADWAAVFDAVLVTSGLGGTPNDITMGAVVTGLDRAFVVNEEAAAQVESIIVAILERRPDIGFDFEPEWHVSMPVDAEALPSEEGLAPDRRAGNVYILPGIPDKVKPMLEDIVKRLVDDVEPRECYTDAPEGTVARELGVIAERLGVGVGSYPSSGGLTRAKLTGGDPAALDDATTWFRSNVTVGFYESEAAVETVCEAEAGGEEQS